MWRVWRSICSATCTASQTPRLTKNHQNGRILIWLWINTYILLGRSIQPSHSYFGMKTRSTAFWPIHIWMWILICWVISWFFQLEHRLERNTFSLSPTPCEADIWFVTDCQLWIWYKTIQHNPLLSSIIHFSSYSRVIKVVYPSTFCTHGEAELEAKPRSRWCSEICLLLLWPCPLRFKICFHVNDTVNPKENSS